MFSKHVNKELSAYCHGEVTPARSRDIAEHLIGCLRCRAEFEEIKLGARFAERLPQLQAPDSLWQELELLIENQHSTRITIKKRAWLFPVFMHPVPTAIAAVLLVAVGIVAFWILRQETSASWEVARVGGAPTIGSARIGQTGRLAVGQWLETDNTSSAKINVASIGQVEIDPNTRIRLLQTQPTEHRLELERGRLSAHIWAPPRLFFVDTPSAVAADLGCAYTLEVDDAGSSLLHVTSGWVALQLKDRESIVPAGAACATRPGIGPGTPYFEDSSELFRKALTKLDFEPRDIEQSKTSPLNIVLAEARGRDTLTLWNLLYRVEGADRVQVFDRLATLAPPPQDVTREGALQLDEKMLHLWKGNLENSWSNESGLRKGWLNIWTRAIGKINGAQSKR
ncbi:MAG: FecR domain-containing protein [Acidobacteriota bacterium]